MTDIYSVALLDILPESLKKDRGVQALAEAITPEIQTISRAIAETVLLPRLDELPEDVVDLLAWQRHIDFYDTTLPLEKKRELVRYAGEAHKRKGTPWAVDQVVSAAFDDSVVSEWFEYGGEPYYFKVMTTDRITSEKKLAELIRAIHSVKNKRSRLESIAVRRDNRLELFIGGAVATMKISTIKPANDTGGA
ncbi:phage tail protein I [Brevibacillus ruminantium]|uniref:Phage tail protein I n=1 Tax=Brevibacillus ruminantium TaxID=2950604 RepID=A0ABY4WL12_9BACL|nr:phage tail protein I [Brevibacillus ruminantium]USG67456.1 phage tail protein I [Brevibacillus ruminantium]